MYKTNCQNQLPLADNCCDGSVRIITLGSVGCNPMESFR